MPRECAPDDVRVGGASVVVPETGKASYMAKGGSLSGLLGRLTDHNKVKTFDNQ